MNVKINMLSNILFVRNKNKIKIMPRISFITFKKSNSKYIFLFISKSLIKNKMKVEIKVDTAAPIAPYLGTKIKFKNKFTIAAIKDVINTLDVLLVTI